MSYVVKLSAAAIVLAMAGCATHQTSNSQTSSAPASQPAASQATASSTGTASQNVRIVKSQDGRFDGEMIGTPAAGSKFAKVKIGMTMNEVNKLIGTPDNMSQHETGKRWIPFYYGNDVTRIETMYKGEGCLTYTGGNQFGAGGNELIRIAVDANGACFE